MIDPDPTNAAQSPSPELESTQFPQVEAMDAASEETVFLGYLFAFVLVMNDERFPVCFYLLDQKNNQDLTPSMRGGLVKHQQTTLSGFVPEFHKKPDLYQSVVPALKDTGAREVVQEGLIAVISRVLQGINSNTNQKTLRRLTSRKLYAVGKPVSQIESREFPPFLADPIFNNVRKALLGNSA